LAQAKDSSASLSLSMYESLAQPSQNNPVAYYNHPAPNLFNAIIYQYMMPGQMLVRGVKS
ncbi:MAG TPA: COX aromatic rich motif-containing protein, partial [Candidatus Saccharimonadales bacterium]|nr:COX aromatic rich motif-containing protein [Candidatus Saccharimonadales bacterium]